MAEVNACGTMLLYHCTGGTAHVEVPADQGGPAVIKMASTAGPPPIVPTADTAPQEWSVEYHIPFALFEQRFGAGRPATGQNWRANFYACGGSRPHYGNWAPLKEARPGQMGKFHCPQAFAPLHFVANL